MCVREIVLACVHAYVYVCHYVCVCVNLCMYTVCAIACVVCVFASVYTSAYTHVDVCMCQCVPVYVPIICEYDTGLSHAYPFLSSLSSKIGCRASMQHPALRCCIPVSEVPHNTPVLENRHQ